MTDHRKYPRPKVSVPFEIMDGYAVQRGTATGVHATAGLILVRWENGTTTSELSLHGAVHPLTDEERAEWVKLKRAASAAQDALRAFTHGRTFDVRSRVAAEIRRAMGE